MTPSDYILQLARTFPCLERKLRHWKQPFDADAFYAMMGPWSSGERLCGLFILNVWNPGYAEGNGWRFDLIDFVGTADAAHRQALLAWIKDPYFP